MEISSFHQNKNVTGMKNKNFIQISKIILPGLGLLMSLSMNAAAQSELQAYQDTAAAQNPTIQYLYKQYEASLERIPQAKTLPDPVLGLGIFVSPVETRVGPQRGNISLSQQFPWFGQLNAQEQAAVEKAKSDYMKMISVRTRINFEVAVNYYNYYILRSAERIMQENITLLNTIKNLAGVKFASGTGSMVDVLQVEMELGELENQLSFLNDSEAPLNQRFEELINAPLSGSVVFPQVLWEDTLSLPKDIMQDAIIINNPSLQGFDHQILALNLEAVAADKAGAPSFNVGINYIFVGEQNGVNIPDNGKDAILLPVIGIRLPVYRKKYTAMVREKKLQQEALQFNRTSTANQLTSEMEKGYRDYLDAVRRVSLYTRLSEIAGQAQEILLTDYTTAATDFEEIIRMNRRQLKYELELEKARAERNTAVAYLKYLMGN